MKDCVVCSVRCVWRVDLTVGVVWRAGRPRGLAQAGRGVRRPPLLPCCQEYLHVPSTTVYPKARRTTDLISLLKKVTLKVLGVCLRGSKCLASWT